MEEHYKSLEVAEKAKNLLSTLQNTLDTTYEELKDVDEKLANFDFIDFVNKKEIYELDVDLLLNFYNESYNVLVFFEKALAKFDSFFAKDLVNPHVTNCLNTDSKKDDIYDASDTFQNVGAGFSRKMDLCTDSTESGVHSENNHVFPIDVDFQKKKTDVCVENNSLKETSSGCDSHKTNEDSEANNVSSSEFDLKSRYLLSQKDKEENYGCPDATDKLNAVKNNNQSLDSKLEINTDEIVKIDEKFAIPLIWQNNGSNDFENIHTTNTDNLIESVGSMVLNSPQKDSKNEHVTRLKSHDFSLFGKDIQNSDYPKLNTDITGSSVVQATPICLNTLLNRDPVPDLSIHDNSLISIENIQETKTVSDLNDILVQSKKDIKYSSKKSDTVSHKISEHNSESIDERCSHIKSSCLNEEKTGKKVSTVVSIQEAKSKKQQITLIDGNLSPDLSNTFYIPEESESRKQQITLIDGNIRPDSSNTFHIPTTNENISYLQVTQSELLDYHKKAEAIFILVKQQILNKFLIEIHRNSNLASSNKKVLDIVHFSIEKNDSKLIYKLKVGYLRARRIEITKKISAFQTLFKQQDRKSSDCVSIVNVQKITNEMNIKANTTTEIIYLKNPESKNAYNATKKTPTQKNGIITLDQQRYFIKKQNEGQSHDILTEKKLSTTFESPLIQTNSIQGSFDEKLTKNSRFIDHQKNVSFNKKPRDSSKDINTYINIIFLTLKQEAIQFDSLFANSIETLFLVIKDQKNTFDLLAAFIYSSFLKILIIFKEEVLIHMNHFLESRLLYLDKNIKDDEERIGFIITTIFKDACQSLLQGVKDENIFEI